MRRVLVGLRAGMQHFDHSPFPFSFVVNNPLSDGGDNEVRTAHMAWVLNGCLTCIEVLLVFNLREFHELLQMSVHSHTCLELRISRAVVISTAQLIYKVWTCLLGKWVMVCLESFHRGKQRSGEIFGRIKCQR